MTVNNLITQGMGSYEAAGYNAGLITFGASGDVPDVIIDAIERPLRLRLGQSGTKRRLAEFDEVIVWSKMIEKNGVVPREPIKGWVRVRVRKEAGFASVMAESARAVRGLVKVAVQRLK